MRRRSNLALLVGVLAVACALTGPGALSAAQEASREGGAAALGHSSAAEVQPMKLEPTLAIYTLVVFLGLLAILRKYAWQPLLTAMRQREEHLEHVLVETERARNESEALLSDHRKQMARAGDEVRGILEKGRNEAQAAALEIVRQAQGEAEAARQRAQRDIASARDQALAEIWHKTADMAVSVAGRVLSKELSADEQRRLLEAAIDELPASAGSNGQEGIRR